MHFCTSHYFHTKFSLITYIIFFYFQRKVTRLGRMERKRTELNYFYLHVWAHRSYILSERSKAMSDLRFSEWKKLSVERWANCQKKEFAHRSKWSLNLKERAYWAVRSLSDITMLSFWGAVYCKNTRNWPKNCKSKRPCPSQLRYLFQRKHREKSNYGPQCILTPTDV